MSAEPRQAALAQRLVLAHLVEHDAYDVTVGHIGDCPDCWRGIAEYLAAVTAGLLENHEGGRDKAISFAVTA